MSAVDADIDLACNVEDLLRRRPELVAFFLRRRMLCPGCPMACFDTLEDVARNYRLPADGFLAEVRAAAGEAA